LTDIQLTAENYRQVHQATIEDVAQGNFNILTLMDCLPWFKTGGDWTPWRAFNCATYGLPMTPRELEIFQHCTGRRTAPTEPATEVWGIVGRRGKKSANMALNAVWRALFFDYTPYLAPNERPKVPIVAQNKAQAKQIRAYVLGILKTSNLRCFLETEDPPAWSIPLTNGVDIEIQACNLMAGRSFTSVFGVLDEVAFFQANEDSAHPDEDIVRGIQAGMAKIPGAFIAGVSSPWARRGVLYRKFEEYWGRDTGILVWKATSEYMDPGNEQLALTVAKVRSDDPVACSSEYDAEFRSDVMAFIPEEVVTAAIQKGRGWNEPRPDIRYFAFVDPSSLVTDDFALGISHAEGGRLVLDLVEAISPGGDPPRRPFQAVAQIAKTLQRFGIRFVTGDQYARNFAEDEFRKHGIGYLYSEETRSDLYGELLPYMMQRIVDLPDDPKLKAQLLSLDRVVTKTGRESIDHPRDGHDDSANVAAGSLAGAAKIGLKLRPAEAQKPQGTLVEQRAREFQAYLKGLQNPDEKGGSKWDYLNRGGR
jgi:hypothetical protein